jgi:hypothetical protein
MKNVETEGGDRIKAPNPKDQAPEKLQVPNSNAGAWLLDLPWPPSRRSGAMAHRAGGSLEVEAWLFSSVPFAASGSKIRKPVPGYARLCQAVQAYPPGRGRGSIFRLPKAATGLQASTQIKRCISRDASQPMPLFSRFSPVQKSTPTN